MTQQNFNLQQNVNFKLVTSKIPGVEFFCTNLNWPSVSIGSIEMPTHMGNHYEPGVGLQFTPLVVDFIVDEDMSNYFSVYNWMRECSIPSAEPSAPYKYPNGSFFPFADVAVTVLDNNLNGKYTVSFVNAFPIDLGTLQFSSDIDQPVPTRCSVTLQFDYFQREGTQTYSREGFTTI
jgi:hypothetical protein